MVRIHGSCDLHPARVGLAGFRIQDSGNLACEGGGGDLCLLLGDGIKGLDCREDLLKREAVAVGFVKTLLTFPFGLLVAVILALVSVEDDREKL